MSLDKSIEHGKEYRKQYTGGKLCSKSCRNHGTCIWCESNRRYNEFRQEEKYRYAITEYNKHFDQEGLFDQ